MADMQTVGKVEGGYWITWLDSVYLQTKYWHNHLSDGVAKHVTAVRVNLEEY